MNHKKFLLRHELSNKVCPHECYNSSKNRTCLRNTDGFMSVRFRGQDPHSIDYERCVYVVFMMLCNPKSVPVINVLSVSTAKLGKSIRTNENRVVNFHHGEIIIARGKIFFMNCFG